MVMVDVGTNGKRMKNPFRRGPSEYEQFMEQGLPETHESIELAGGRTVRITPEVRQSLEKWYGKEKAAGIKYAEGFEICEYGNQPNDEEIKRLFPMLDN